MICRTLVGACALIALSAAPAAAGYEDVLGEGTGRPPVVVRESAPRAGGALPRTGSDTIVPMAEVASVMIGGGALLVLAARRRSSTRSSAAA